MVVGKFLHPNNNETVHGGELTGTSSNGTRTFPILFNPSVISNWFPPQRPRPTLPPGVTSTDIPQLLDENKPSKCYNLETLLLLSLVLNFVCVIKTEQQYIQISHTVIHHT